MSPDPLPFYLHRLIRVFKPYFTHDLLTSGEITKDLRIHLFMKCDIMENYFNYEKKQETLEDLNTADLPSIEESIRMYKEMIGKNNV